jgi:hypothetical protein
MPAWYPEGNAPAPGDTEERSAQKVNQLLYDLRGDKGPAWFPEGSKPQPGDDYERSLAKINALNS